MHDARAVANTLIAKDKSLSPIQLVKLVYICHGWMLGFYGRPLIEQPVETWHYGPIIADVYRSFNDYKSTGKEIRRRLWRFSFGPPFHATYDAAEESIISQVSQKYGQMTGVELSKLTSALGSPWDQVWRELEQRGAVIPNELIREYYAEEVG